MAFTGIGKLLKDFVVNTLTTNDKTIPGAINELNEKKVTLYRAEFSGTSGTITLSDAVENYDWIEFCYLSVINGYGVHQGKIRSGHDAEIVLTSANGAYIGRMSLYMKNNIINVKSNNRTQITDGVIQEIPSILMIEINGLRN